MMKECSNCGASVREGAKFCTRCGVRLDLTDGPASATEPESQSTATTTTAAPGTSPEESTRTYVPNDASGDQQDLTSHQDAGVSDTRESPWAAGTDATTASDDQVPAYESSWPDDSAPMSDTPPETDASPEATWPESSAADTGTETTSESAEDDGPSVWESWAPTSASDSPVSVESIESAKEPDTSEAATDQASAEPHGRTANTPFMSSAATSAEGNPDGSAIQEIRTLVDTLQQRLARLDAPVTVQDRGVDADDLADELNGWAASAPRPDDLLDVIRNARANPRDIEAITSLADRASELEALVEHYGTICTDAQRWVARLRSQDDTSTT